METQEEFSDREKEDKRTAIQRQQTVSMLVKGGRKDPCVVHYAARA